jgi:hypothetical protein
MPPSDSKPRVCARSLSHDLVDICRLERIIVLALDNDGSDDEPRSATQPLPSR